MFNPLKRTAGSEPASGHPFLGWPKFFHHETMDPIVAHDAETANRAKAMGFTEGTAADYPPKEYPKMVVTATYVDRAAAVEAGFHPPDNAVYPIVLTKTINSPEEESGETRPGFDIETGKITK